MATITVTSPTATTPINPTAPFTVLGTTAGVPAVVLVEVTLRPLNSTLGQAYVTANPGVGGYGTWSASIQPVSAANNRLLARATLADNSQIFFPQVPLNYTADPGPGPGPGPTPGTIRISSPTIGSTFPVTAPLPISGMITGPVASVDVTLRDPASVVSPIQGQAYQPATMGPGGTWSVVMTPAKETYRKILARATLTGGTKVYSSILINFTGVITPPPDACPIGQSRNPQTGLCEDNEPEPPPATGGSIWDKIVALFPTSIQPYALPIVIGAGGLVMMKGGIFKRGGTERYRIIRSGVR